MLRTRERERETSTKSTLSKRGAVVIMGGRQVCVREGNGASRINKAGVREIFQSSGGVGEDGLVQDG